MIARQSHDDVFHKPFVPHEIAHHACVIHRGGIGDFGIAPDPLAGIGSAPENVPASVAFRCDFRRARDEHQKTRVIQFKIILFAETGADGKSDADIVPEDFLHELGRKVF